MNRWFNVMDIGDPEVRELLDAIIFVANPKEKRGSHITIRGPYDKSEKAEKWNRDSCNDDIEVTGVGIFFGASQNTVYLKCDSFLIGTLWDKGDYGYSPHITLYDGSDRGFAERLYNELNTQNISFVCPAGRISTMKSLAGQGGFDLLVNIDVDSVKKVFREHLSIKDIENMDAWERITIINRLFPVMINKAHLNYSMSEYQKKKISIKKPVVLAS